jgi:hypothetical protein
MPRVFASERAAWEGPLPGVDGGTLHVEAAAHLGSIVSFRSTGPWEPVVPQTTPPVASSGISWRIAATVLGTVLVFGTLMLARANLRAGRGDRRGAWRLFCFAFVATVVSWLFGARHYASTLIENDRLFEFLGYALRRVGTIWLLYIALEPYVRRFAPDILMSWTRVLSGQFVDPRVGRDVLVGVTAGVGIALLGASYFVVGQIFGAPPPQPRVTNLRMLLGTSSALGLILSMIANNLANGFYVAIAFGVGRAATGRTWGGAAIATVLLGIFVLGEAGGDEFLMTLVFIAAFAIPLVLVLLYFGILPVVIAFFVNQAINNTPLTLQPSMPYAPVALWIMFLIGGLAAFGYYASRGGKPLFGHVLQAE